MIAEHEKAVLMADVPDAGMFCGDVGTVVGVYADGEAYAVEFLTLRGKTIAVVTVPAASLRPVHRTDITHVRESATLPEVAAVR